MIAAAAPTLETLASFNAMYPFGGLIADASGVLFGTTQGGNSSDGTVFEIVKTASGYGAIQTIASFNGSNGNGSVSGLVGDLAGDLFGTTQSGGSSGYGTVFEIAKSGAGFGSIQTIASFTGINGIGPYADLIADAAGNLFGTTIGGGSGGDGTVFEIKKAGSGYDAIQTLASFGGSDGSQPYANLIADLGGNLFGTTTLGGSGGDGTVFEIAKTNSGYGAIQTLASFNGSLDGATPHGGLITDSAGDLFGTAYSGGGAGEGTVFEIVKASSGYGAIQLLATFAGGNGAGPYAGLTLDAAGDLFGTTQGGGSVAGAGDGTVFEIAKSGSGYGAIETLFSFNGSNGANPYAGLIADARGNLFGTTHSGGDSSDGTVFEITGAGFAPFPLPKVTVALTSDTGASATDGITRSAGVTGGGDAGASVSLTVDGTAVAPVTANGSGLWRYTPTGLADGQHTILASETNALGTGTATLTFTLDTTKPLVTAALATDTGSSATDRLTSLDTITGGGDPNAAVAITVDGAAGPAVTANGSGAWSLTPSGLADGTHTITATETDLAGNTATKSLTFTLDTTAPTVAITSHGGTVAQTRQTVAGTVDVADAGRSVSLYDNGSTTALASTTVQSDGSWSKAVTLGLGPNTLVAKVVDTAGNTGTSTGVLYTVGSAPAAATTGGVGSTLLFADAAPTSQTSSMGPSSAEEAARFGAALPAFSTTHTVWSTDLARGSTDPLLASGSAGEMVTATSGREPLRVGLTGDPSYL